MYSWHLGTRCGAYPTQRNFTGKNPVALQEFAADLKDTYDNSDVCEEEAVIVLTYLRSDGDREVNEAYTANRLSTDTIPYHVDQWS